MYQNYTTEEREAALRTSLTDIAKRLGYTPVRIGGYYMLKEMDSIRIKNDATWCRWSRIQSGEASGRGGTQIDFMLEFGNCSTVPEAIHEILSMNNICVMREVEIPKQNVCREMVLPDKAEGCRYMFAYLCQTRQLSSEIVSYFAFELKLLYESREHHNLVFLGKNRAGEVKYAMQRGTSDIYGRRFVGDVAGNDKSHGVNIANLDSPILKVFESSIDCMSYIEITGDLTSNKLILGMLSDRPLETFLSEYTHIKEICFCLDNDEPARMAVLGTDRRKSIDGNQITEHTPGLAETYQSRGYIIRDEPALPYGKDYNENLKYYKQHEPERIVGIPKIKTGRGAR